MPNCTTAQMIEVRLSLNKNVVFVYFHSKKHAKQDFIPIGNFKENFYMRDKKCLLTPKRVL
jgi:hypothetical protein